MHHPSSPVPNFVRKLCAASLALATAAAVLPLHAQTAAGQVVAKRVLGEVRDTRGADTVQLAEGDAVMPADVVTTGDNSSVVLVFSTGATVQLGARSQLSIETFLQDPFADAELQVGRLKREPTVSQTRLSLTRGELTANVKKLNTGSSYEVVTTSGVAGVRGTTFRVAFQPAPTDLADSVLSVGTAEGLVMVAAATGASLPAPANQQVELRLQRRPGVAGPPRLTTTALPAAARVRIEQQAQAAITVAATVTFVKLPAAAPASSSGSGICVGRTNSSQRSCRA